MKPSRYMMPKVAAHSSAEVRAVSGTGMTTSMSWSGLVKRRIVNVGPA